MSIKAVLFDLCNTIARFHPPREELQLQACREFGLDVTPQGILKGYVVADDYMSKENAISPIFKRSKEERWRFFGEYERLILQGAGLDVSWELGRKIFARLRKIPYDLVLFDDVLPALKRLKELGLTLGLITNIYEDMDSLCQRLGLSPYLNFSVTSQEVGAEKPHPNIFLAALKRAGVSPAEAIHVGDQYNSDVVGARGVGIRPILIDRDGLQRETDECPRIRSLVEVEGHL
ncbi:MAG: HAD-IA family hydrolase [Dehalococcoidia bacterium]